MRPGASSQRAVILAPTGRDASVAAALIRGLHANERSVMILNTDNRRAISGLDSRAVVEVPCVVTSAGVAPLVALSGVAAAPGFTSSSV